LTITNKSTEIAGELGYVDIYHQPIKLHDEKETPYYLFGIIDVCTQVVWVEVLEETEALTLMFASLKCFTTFSDYYNIKFKGVKPSNTFKELLSGINDSSYSPLERLLYEQNIVYHKSDDSICETRTNSVSKEFWDSIYMDLLKDTFIEDKKTLKQKIVDYLYYYNEKRVHKKLRGMTPNEFNKECFRHL